jgi:hypothetical protein
MQVVAPVPVEQFFEGSSTAVAVYEAIGTPPVNNGAAHDTLACALPAAAVTAVGAPGRAAGVIAADAADTGVLHVASRATVSNV